MADTNWGESISQEDSFWINETIYIPTILETEYNRLRRLLQDNQIMGGIFELKDVIELSIKLPVILAMAISLNDDANRLSITKSRAFGLLLSGSLSLGHWVSIAKNLLDEPFLSASIKEILFNTLEYLSVDNKQKESINVVAWRNKRIGHGAFSEELNEEIIEEICAILRSLKHVFESNSNLFTGFKLYQNSSNVMKVLELADIESENPIDELLVKFNDQFISLTPFIIVIKSRIYLYDSFLDGKKVGYLDYVHADKIRIVVDEITNIYKDLNQKNIILSLGNANGLVLEEDEVSYLTSSMRDLIKPDYIINQIKSWIHTYSKGIFRLQMDSGMGKSTIVKMLDPFLKESLGKKHIDIPGVSVRCFYINNTYSARLSFFRDSIRKDFYKTDNGKVFKGNDISFNTKEEFAKFLNQFIEYYKQLSYSGYEVNTKLLLIIDALDESFKNNKSEILSVIPDSELLVDDIYIILTYRTDRMLDYLVRNEVACISFTDSLIVSSDNRNNQELVEQYILKFIPHISERDSSIIQSIAIASTTFLRANILRYIPSIIKHRTILFDSDVFQSYFEKLHFLYSDKYYEKVKSIVILLSLGEIPLSLKQMSVVLDETLDDFQILCILDDLGPILSKVHTSLGVTYSIKHIEIRQFILNYFSFDAELLIITFLNKIIDLLNSSESIRELEWLRLLLVFKNMKSLNYECFMREMYTYKFYMGVLRRFSEYSNESLIEYWSEYASSMYVELGLSIINSYNNNSEDMRPIGDNQLTNDDTIWVEAFALSLISIGFHRSNSEDESVLIVNNIINLLNRVSSERKVDFIPLFDSIFEADKVLQKYFVEMFDKKVNSIEFTVKEDVVYDSHMSRYGLMDLPISFHPLFDGPRECVLSLLNSLIEYLSKIETHKIDQLQVFQLLQTIYFISINDEYIPFGTFTNMIKLSYHSFIESLLIDFRPIEKWEQSIMKRFPLDHDNILSVYEKQCIKRCIDSCVMPDIHTNLSPLFGEFDPNVLYLENDLETNKQRIKLAYPVRISILKSYLSELYYVIKFKKIFYKEGYYPMIASWIFATPNNLSLGTNREPDFSPRNLGMFERFLTSKVKLSQFDRNWETIRSAMILFPRTVFYLKFLCNPIGQSISSKSRQNDDFHDVGLGYIEPYQIDIETYSLWNERVLDWSIVNRIFLSIIREFRTRLRRHLNYRFSTIAELDDYMDKVIIIDKRDIMIIKKFLVLYNKFKSSVEITYIIQELKSILFNEQLINILNRFFGRIGRQLNLQMLTELGHLSQNDIKNLDYVTYQEKLEIERKKYN